MPRPGWLRSAGRPLRDARRHREQLRDARVTWETEWAIEREIEEIVGSAETVIAGPWLSEVGYETLYWIPFLRWVRQAFRLAPERVVAVSRGGVASWYADVASRYLDIWDLVEPAVFARRTAERGSVKQQEIAAFDRELLEAVERTLGVGRVAVLHPSLMYRLFALFWSGHRSLGFLDRHTRFARMQAGAAVPAGALPDGYVAVKLYSARSMPDSPALRRVLRQLVAGVAERAPVVLLDTGLALDEHADYELGGGRVVSARPLMTPRTNLGMQTAIIAGARGFVSTCGSLAWMAPMLGTDTSALFVDPKWLHVHLGVALRASHKVAAGRFAACDLRALHPLDNLVPDGSDATDGSNAGAPARQGVRALAGLPAPEGSGA